MNTHDTQKQIQRMEAELQALIQKRNDARGKDPYLFRWYADRACKLEIEIRQAKWEASA